MPQFEEPLADNSTESAEPKPTKKGTDKRRWPEPDDVEIAKLREEHDRIQVLEVEDYCVIIAQPEYPRLVVKRFLDTLNSDKKRRPEAVAQVFRACVVWPDKDTLKGMIDEAPGLEQTFGGAAAEFLGLHQDVVKKG